MNGYLVYYGSKHTKVYAATSFAAQEKGIAFFRVPGKPRTIFPTVWSDLNDGVGRRSFSDGHPLGAHPFLGFRRLRYR